jgi:methylmalonyl-CoA/ethylmalonyl-CoA epimerase
MLTNVEHIGIAVKDLVHSNRLFEQLFAIPPYKHEEVASEAVLTSFFKINQTKIELLQSTDPTGEGIHHIAFEVDDIQSELARLVAAGFTPLHSAPKQGADNKLVCFLHPKETNGVLIELCQEIKEDSKITP